MQRIHEALNNRGLSLFLDDEQLDGDIDIRMAAGIDQSVVVLVYVTRNYMHKVNQDGRFDNCKKEFQYATGRKIPEMIIPVIMEPDMTNQRLWEGPLGTKLNSHMFVDMSNVWTAGGDPNERFDAKIEILLGRIRTRTDRIILNA